jgi:hypothetical protein
MEAMGALAEQHSAEITSLSPRPLYRIVAEDEVFATVGDTGVTWTAMSMEMLYWADQDEDDGPKGGS